MGVEYDGWYWHKDKVEMDQEKNRVLEEEIVLLRVREEGLERLSENDIFSSKEEISLDTTKAIFLFILENPVFELSAFKGKIANYLGMDDWAAGPEFDKIQFERNGVVYERSICHLFPGIASQWHYEKNHPLVPDQFTPNSRKKVWWKDRNGREWEADILSRTLSANKKKERHRNQIDLFGD